jgi:hypothetical protein
MGKRQKEKLMFFLKILLSKKFYLLFVLLFPVIESLYPQSVFSPIPLSLLPDKNAEIPYSYSIVGKSNSTTSIVNILSENNFIENNNSHYIIELFSNSFKFTRKKKNILLGSFDYSTASLKDFSSMVDAEAGYSRLISLKNNGNNDYKINELFSKAEQGKEGARIGDSIELEFVYRSKTKKVGYLTIYLFTTDGMIAQIFPNKYDTNNILNPNDNYKFPTQNAIKPYKLEAAPPVGNDRLVLIITQKSFSFSPNNIKNYGHLLVLLKNKSEELKKITEELKSTESFGLYEIVLDIKE